MSRSFVTFNSILSHSMSAYRIPSMTSFPLCASTVPWRPRETVHKESGSHRVPVQGSFQLTAISWTS